MTMPGTVALVVSHNGRQHLRRCLPSLLDQSLPFAAVLVVDNGSSDGTAYWLQKEHPGMELLQLDGNHGFSGGVNHGLRQLLRGRRADCVALVNNDVTLGPDWHLEAHRALMADPRAGSCATCLLRADRPELVDSGGITWAGPGRAENYLSGRAAPPADEPGREIFGACAAAALYRTELFEQIGLFDEALFAYQEDVDLALRARAAGWRCVFAPGARGLHTGHGSNRPFPGNGTWADYYNASNRLAVLIASLPGPDWRNHWRAILAGEGAALLAAFREQRAAAVLAGFGRGLIRIPGLVLRRCRKTGRRT